jgi:hypothetical protein
MVLTGSGTFSNYGSLALVGFGEDTNYEDTSTIGFTVTTDPITGLTVSADVLHNSLTASHLDTGSNGGATAGYVLSADSNGDFQWIVGAAGSGGVSSINDKNYIMPFSTSGNGQSTGLTITGDTIDGSNVYVTVNGQEFNVGNGLTSSVYCYFSNDGGSTAKGFSLPNKITTGDELFWNGNEAGVDLYSTWRLSLYYEV